MEPFATLINRKLVLPSTKTNFLAVDLNFFTEVLSNYVGQIFVDEAWYLSRYPDILRGTKSGEVDNATTHYRRFGYFEHRMPHEIIVNETYYLSEYEDVRAAVDRNVFTSGQAHFQELGYSEGRMPYPNFKLRLNGG